MPEQGVAADPLTRRMTVLRDSAPTPLDQLAVAVDFFRGAARKASRTAAPTDAVVLLVVADIWRQATELLPTRPGKESA